MNVHLQRAIKALETGAIEVREMSSESTSSVRNRLRKTVEEVLTHLEADESAEPEEPEDIMSQLQRQSQDIAEDLRRVEDLMKRRTRGE